MASALPWADKLERHLDPARDRYPCSVVWTPIPLLTWLVPWVGHVGIADSDGTTFDFAGPYFIGEGDLAFGRPAKVWSCSPGMCSKKPLAESHCDFWDECVHASAEAYRERMYNLCCNNCHSYVACALNRMGYHAGRSWNMFLLFFALCMHSQYVSWAAVAKAYVPSLILWTLVLVLALAA